MNSPFPALAPGPGRNWVRRVVEVLVAIAVVAVAAAAFIFSYDGVHAIALLGGMSAQLARYYPALFDAVLVIACVTAVVLRDGRWYARLWAWVVAIVVLAAIGYADVLHAANHALSHQETAGAVAAAPAAAVLLAFSLLVALLQKSKASPRAGLSDLGLAAQPPLGAHEPPALPPVPSSAFPPPGFPPPAPPAPPAVELPAVAAPPVPGPIALPPAPASPAPAPAPATDVADRPPPAAEDAVTGVAPPEEPAPGAMPPTVPVLDPDPGQAPTTRPRGIRYAGGGFSSTAAPTAVTEAAAAGPAAEPAPAKAGQTADYWDGQEAAPFAGLVYQERANRAAPGETGRDHDTEGQPPGDRRRTPDLDDDAPPFATAPFASVPRLNRVRSTPAPPSDESE